MVFDNGLVGLASFVIFAYGENCHIIETNSLLAYTPRGRV